MTAKEIFESLDLSQLPKDAADKFRKVEKATKGFTIESEKVNTFMRGAYKKIKETKPTALKNLKVEEKIIKKEVKKGENTQVVEDLEYKVKGTKKVSKKTATPSKPKRKGETAMERARKIRKKGEAWKDALVRAQKELKAEATKAKKDAEKVVSTTSQALKSLEKMIQNDPKLKGYPRTYGKQSKRIDANKDAKIKAKPAGKRVSKKGHKNQYGESKGGRVYWENRDNRSDRYAPNFPNKVFLEMGGETDDLGFPTGHTFLVVEVSPDGTKNLIKSTTDYMTALMSSAVTRGRKTNKDNRVVIVDKEDKKVIHEAFEAGGEITITPTQLVNNPDYLVGTTTMTELFECGGVTAYQEGGEVFVTPNPLLNAGSGDYVAGSNTMSNMFAKGGMVNLYYGGEQEDETLPASSEKDAANIAMRNGAEHYEFVSRMAKGGSVLNQTMDENKAYYERVLNSFIENGHFDDDFKGSRFKNNHKEAISKFLSSMESYSKTQDKSNASKYFLLVLDNTYVRNDLFRGFLESEKELKKRQLLLPSKFAKGGSLKRFNHKIGDLHDDLEDAKMSIDETQEFLQDIYGKDLTYQDRLAYRYAKGGKLPKNIKYYGVNEIKEYRLKNGDKIDASGTLVDSGVYVSATKTMKPKEKEFQQKLEFKKGGATNWKGEKINWKEDYIYIPRYEIEEVELENGKVIKGDYVVSGLYLPKSDRTKLLEKEMKARLKKGKMETGGTINSDDIEFANEENEAIGKFLLTTSEGKEIWNSSSNRNEFEKKIRAYHSSKGLPNWMFDDGDDDGIDWATFGDLWSNKELKQAMKKMESGGTIVAADPSAAMEDLNQTYGYESVYEKGGETLPSAQSIIDKFRSQGVTDETIVEIAVNQFNNYLKESGRLKNPKGANDLANLHYEIIQLLRPNLKMEKGGRLGFDGLAKKVAKRYEGKPVKSKYQKEYGKTYSKEEAMEVGRKVAAKVYGQQQANMKKMAEGGATSSSSMTNSKRLVREWKKQYDFSKLLVDSARPILNEKRLHSLGMKIEQLEWAIKREEENPSGMQNLKRLVKEWKKPYDFSKLLVDSARPILNEKELHDLGMKIEQLEWAIKRDEEAQGQKMAKGGYLVRFEDEGKYETKKFAKLDEAKDFYNFISEQKMNYGPQKTQLVSNEDGKVLMGSSELPQLAKGGMTKGQSLAENFNLQDKVQNVEFWNNDVVVTGKDGKIARIDLDEGTRTQLNAKGGSLDAHGLQLGDKIVKDLGSVLKVTTKDGGMVYVDLANGYRGAEMPLPFEKGGAVGGMKIPDVAKKFGKTTADVMKQVEIGAKHEMEHTSDAKKARKIALDHLSGDLDYYTKLNKLGL